MSKICILCGKDCSNLPRKKDAKGQYACQACVDARQAKSDAPKPAKSQGPATSAAPSTADILFSDSSTTRGEPCPNCARMRAKGAVLCTHCGFNSATGKSLKTAVDTTDGPTDYDAKRKKAKVDAATRPLAALIGGAIGAAAGALVWGMITYSMKGIEIPFSRIIVGACAGFGAYKGAAGYAGAMSGGWAAACTIAAVLLARMAIVEQAADDVSKQITKAVSTVSELEVKREFATEVLLDMETKGARIQFRDVDTSDFIQFEQLPEPLESEVIKRWNALGEGGQKAYTRKIEEEYKKAGEEIGEAVKESVKDSGLSRRYIYRFGGFIVAIGVAYTLGSGGSLLE